MLHTCFKVESTAKKILNVPCRISFGMLPSIYFAPGVNYVNTKFKDHFVTSAQALIDAGILIIKGDALPWPSAADFVAGFTGVSKRDLLKHKEVYPGTKKSLGHWIGEQQKENRLCYMADSDLSFLVEALTGSRSQPREDWNLSVDELQEKFDKIRGIYDKGAFDAE